MFLHKRFECVVDLHNSDERLCYGARMSWLCCSLATRGLWWHHVRLVWHHVALLSAASLAIKQWHWLATHPCFFRRYSGTFLSPRWHNRFDCFFLYETASGWCDNYLADIFMKSVDLFLTSTAEIVNNCICVKQTEIREQD